MHYYFEILENKRLKAAGCYFWKGPEELLAEEILTFAKLDAAFRVTTDVKIERITELDRAKIDSRLDIHYSTDNRIWSTSNMVINRLVSLRDRRST